MAANKTVRFGPIGLPGNTTTTIFNPPTLTGGTNVPSLSTNSYYILRHLRVGNKTGAAVNVAGWLGASSSVLTNGSGTEFAWVGSASAGTLVTGVSVPANSYVEWFGMVRMDTADYMAIGAGSASALSVSGEGEIGVN